MTNGSQKLQKQYEYWLNRLIDLSRRNKLLYLKPRASSSSVLSITDELPWQIAAQIVVKKQEFGFLANNNYHEESGRLQPVFIDFPVYHPELQIETLEKHTDSWLQTELPPEKLQSVLTNIYRRSRSAMEEQGYNTLYLALGILRWFDNSQKENELLSPVLLIPAEIRKSSAGARFSLRARPDEIVINPALIQKLLVCGYGDFSFLQQWMEDEEWVDLRDVFDKLYNTLTDKFNHSGWQILNEVYLGLFSFNKFAMYRDLLDHQAQIMQNPAVLKLCGAAKTEQRIENNLRKINSLKLDKISSKHFHPVKDCDSSQKKAILAAKTGFSYVMQGPPGTGKSQTITNIIAEFMADGKSVLFVSEKMVALNVVYDRLKQINLHGFALELHSHKANKKNILSSLEKALQQAERQKPADNENKEALKSDQLRAFLNKYGQSLHRERGINSLSIYQIAGMILQIEKELPPVRHKFHSALDISLDKINRQEELLQNFAASCLRVGEENEHLFRDAGLTRFSPQLKNELLLLIEELNSAIRKQEKNIQELSVPVPANLLNSVQKGHDFHQIFRQFCTFAKNTPESWFQKSETEKIAHKLTELAAEQLELQQKMADLSQFLNITELEKPDNEYTDWLKVLHDHKKCWFRDWPLLYSSYKGVKKKLIPLIHSQKWDINKAIELLQTYQNLSERLTLLQKKVALEEWPFPETPDIKSDNLGDFVNVFRGFRRQMEKNPEFCRSVDISEIFFRRRIELDKALQKYNNQLTEISNIITNICNNLCIMSDYSAGVLLRQGEFPELINLLENWQNNIDSLFDWSRHIDIRQKLTTAEMLEFVRVNRLRTAPENLHLLWRHTWLSACLEEALNAEDGLSGFHVDDLQKCRQRFIEMDGELVQKAGAMVSRKVLQRYPDPYLTIGEIGILKTELRKKRSQMPIRKLFSRIPGMLQRLKPCMLMSPLSAAMYLDPQYINFDLVIFDEASQIFPEDAIGTIARARQCIVVGDSKQMPPTDFFNSVSFGEDNEGEDDNAPEIMESVLDLAGRSLPLFPLLWHYRSRHEHLICFSNQYFYDRRLITFPAPGFAEKLYGIYFNHVPDGVYDIGKTRTNYHEAQALCRRVLEILKTNPSCSIGIITMSQAQQDLTLDLLENADLKNPVLEKQLATDTENEGLFVKNLENVQGDERDIILFGIGYGPDSQGKISRNFGPLNREGGERRLNVAVSRARKRLEVFCSFLPEQLELAETASEGAKLLRKYLQFARHPELQNNAVQTGQKPEDPLCLDVKSALEKQGFQVHTGIGSSDYRLDLAVVHPENPKRYILGLECDGTAYRNAETATERERLRPSVLNAHGWQIYRIWSMDWHNRKTQIIEEVTGLINELCRQQTPVESLDFNRPAQDKLTENNEEPEMRENDAAAPKPDSPDLTAGTTTGTRLPVFHDYVFAEPRKQPEGADNIWKNPEKTAADLWHVIDHQAPIHEEELFRIVAGYWDCKRLTPKLRNFLSEILDRLNRSAGKTEIERRHNYVYCCDREILPRLYPPEKGIRDISSFAPEELQQIIDYIAQQAGACTKEEMISTVAKELGYKRSGPEIQRRVEELYSP